MKVLLLAVSLLLSGASAETALTFSEAYACTFLSRILQPGNLYDRINSTVYLQVVRP